MLTSPKIYLASSPTCSRWLTKVMCPGLLRKVTKMSDKLYGDSSSGRSRTASPKPDTSEPRSAKPKRKGETPTLTDDLTGKFLRVGNALYRTSDDKKPIARLERDRLKTSNIDALPEDRKSVV